ncbi:MAG: hypothetical protein SCALA702_37110 [Melioribacteraceae bacterium]|nr:MAG: hypothetical protein SCALA702_37110 [Melioribacteraceae bacterium]
MSYSELYNAVWKMFSANENRFGNLEFHKLDYVSTNQYEQNELEGDTDENYNVLLQYFLKHNEYSQKYIFRYLNAPDNSFDENNNFNYYIIKQAGNEKIKSAILLLHGLNERNWAKYLPWAIRLAEITGKAIILFPLAFHMDRAPSEWSDPRIMKQVAKERMKLFPDARYSTFANAALSTRLQFAPERLLLSGVQTYDDIVNLMKEIKTGGHKYFEKDANIDLFGYSIGAFLGEILLTSNPDNLFDSSRMCMFCGGAVLDTAIPVSKAIMDSEAARAMQRYYRREEFISGKANDITRMVKSFEAVGIYFKSLINSTIYPALTKSFLNSVKDKIKVIGLGQDTVFSVDSLKNTFGNGLSGVLDILDYNYKYTHEKPFSENHPEPDKVDYAFEKTFAIAGGFLS